MNMWLYTEKCVTPASTVASKYGDWRTRGPIEIENCDMRMDVRYVIADTDADTLGEMIDDSPSAPQLLEFNAAFASDFSDADLQVAPTRKLAIVACMDSRMDIFALLGLGNGEAHVIRNAGGVITDDVIRSLCLSQRSLGTREIILVHHTDCGLSKVDEAQFRTDLENEVGVKPWWSLEAFADPYADVVQSINRLEITPFLAYKEHISGYVYNVETGMLEPVERT